MLICAFVGLNNILFTVTLTYYDVYIHTLFWDLMVSVELIYIYVVISVTALFSHATKSDFLSSRPIASNEQMHNLCGRELS